MPADFGCFKFVGEFTLDQQIFYRFSLNHAHPLIATAWEILTGRKENPRGLKPLFHENEWHERIAEAQRLIHAHIDFGGEDLIFLFNSNYQLQQIHLESANTILWKSSPDMVRLSSTDRTQRYSSN